MMEDAKKGSEPEMARKMKTWRKNDVKWPKTV